MTPPGLAWIPSFCSSTSLALDQNIVPSILPTVNALVYKISLEWATPIHHPAALSVWNLFQKWAHRNDSTPEGRMEWREWIHPASGERMFRGFTVHVHLKERLGHQRDEHP